MRRVVFSGDRPVILQSKRTVHALGRSAAFLVQSRRQPSSRHQVDRLIAMRGQSWWMSMGERRVLVERVAGVGERRAPRSSSASFATLLEHPSRGSFGPPSSTDLSPRGGLRASGPQKSAQSRRATHIVLILVRLSAKHGPLCTKRPFLARLLARVGGTCKARRDAADSWASKAAGELEKGCTRGRVAFGIRCSSEAVRHHKSGGRLRTSHFLRRSCLEAQRSDLCRSRSRLRRILREPALRVSIGSHRPDRDSVASRRPPRESRRLVAPMHVEILASIAIVWAGVPPSPDSSPLQSDPPVDLMRAPNRLGPAS